MKIEGDYLTLEEPDAKLEAALDAQYRRIGHLKWHISSGLGDKVLSFLKTLKGGKTSKEIATERLKICNTCPALKLINERKFCGACNCGSWVLSELDGGPVPKLQWADLKCPLRKF